MVPLSKHILVQDNDFVRAGIPLSDGAITPNDILNIQGPGAVQEGAGFVHDKGFR